jgi:IPT/TIG domain
VANMANIHSGGTLVTISGTNMDSASVPVMQIRVDVVRFKETLSRDSALTMESNADTQSNSNCVFVLIETFITYEVGFAHRYKCPIYKCLWYSMTCIMKGDQL